MGHSTSFTFMSMQLSSGISSNITSTKKKISHDWTLQTNILNKINYDVKLLDYRGLEA